MVHLGSLGYLSHIATQNVTFFTQFFGMDSIYELKAAIMVKAYGAGKRFNNNYQNLFYTLLGREDELNKVFLRLSACPRLLDGMLRNLSSYSLFCTEFVEKRLFCKATADKVSFDRFTLHFVGYLEHGVLSNVVIPKLSSQDLNYDAMLVLLLNFRNDKEVFERLLQILHSTELKEQTKCISQVVSHAFGVEGPLSDAMKKKMLVNIATLIEYQKLDKIFSAG